MVTRRKPVVSEALVKRAATCPRPSRAPGRRLALAALTPALLVWRSTWLMKASPRCLGAPGWRRKRSSSLRLMRCPHPRRSQPSVRGTRFLQHRQGIDYPRGTVPQPARAASPPRADCFFAQRRAATFYLAFRLCPSLPLLASAVRRYYAAGSQPA